MNGRGLDKFYVFDIIDVYFWMGNIKKWQRQKQFKIF